MKTFAAVFAHPESHGPQICSIHMISKYSTRVDLLFRNVAETHWRFPANVTLLKDNKFIPQEEVYKKSILKKVSYFLKFLGKMVFRLSKEKYDMIVLFDPMAFFAFSLIPRIFLKKAIVWYHNYDAIDLKNTKKYSLGWFAWKAPHRTFPRIDFFTLPMEERVRLFPVHLLKNKYYIIPNYSLLEIHEAKARQIMGDKVNLVFVGSIGEGHGIEEIIKLLRCKINGKELNFVLKGYIQKDYEEQLLEIAKEYEVQHRLIIYPKGPWGEVAGVIRNCHIGIAVYTGKDQMNSTLGKGGSGKTYQYIAEGLPVLINTGFYEYFKEYKWAVAADLAQESLAASISSMINNYNALSQAAAGDFTRELNCNIFFDHFFKSVAKI